MKSNRQRRREIKARRLRRARQLQELNTASPDARRPPEAVEADLAILARNNNSYGLPLFYVDRPFHCRDCGSDELWTAKQQKWWYEVVGGNINSIAVRCRSCRRQRRLDKQAQLTHMAEMAKQTPHPNEAFFRDSPTRKR